MWKVAKNKKEILRLYNGFMTKYGSKYDDFMREYIKDNFFENLGNLGYYLELLQVYSELGIIAKEDDYYIAQLNKLKEKFDINCNILDVGSGSIPVFANYMAHNQIKLGSGTVTLYEPYLVIDAPKYSNMVLHREEFTETTDISNFDLVTALMPCDVTETLITSVCKNRKDFYISLCGCNHFAMDYGFYSYGGFRPSFYEYIEQAEKLCKKYDMGTLEIDYLDDKYELDYPIIYNKRR